MHLHSTAPLICRHASPTLRAPMLHVLEALDQIRDTWQAYHHAEAQSPEMRTIPRHVIHARDAPLLTTRTINRRRRCRQRADRHHRLVHLPSTRHHRRHHYRLALHPSSLLIHHPRLLLRNAHLRCVLLVRRHRLPWRDHHGLRTRVLRIHHLWLLLLLLLLLLLGHVAARRVRHLLRGREFLRCLHGAAGVLGVDGRAVWVLPDGRAVAAGVLVLELAGLRLHARRIGTSGGGIVLLIRERMTDWRGGVGGRSAA